MLIRHIQPYFQRQWMAIACCITMSLTLKAQTDADGIMMNKNNFCTGLMYNYSSWKQYWEGSFKRDNANLGTVSTQAATIMGNYGLTSKLNVLFGLPYLWTKASAGQLHGMRGIQDLSLWIKWMPVDKNIGKGELTAYAVGGFSTPVTGYVADYLPLSIGLHSKNLSLRAMADYQAGDWFATTSATYVLRSNIKLDRDSYYTTEMHYTNEVKMPDALQFMIRAGFRTERMIAEAIFANWTTVGGFDITKNNMPFPSNKMNMTTAGLNMKYNFPAIDGLSFTGGASYTLAGRNVGQATNLNAGVFYILNFSPKKKEQAASRNK